VALRGRYDAVVVGAGPNGLVAGNVLADAGWDVVVLEAADASGGAVRTAEVTAPGFRNDLFSAFYPLAAVSPALKPLDLERYGLQWAHAPLVVAHPRPDAPAVVLSRDPVVTADGLERIAQGSGEAWLELFELWRRCGEPLLQAVLSPFPPARPLFRLAARLGPRRWLDFARFTLLPVRRLAEEQRLGPGGVLLLAGNALHADLSPESTMSGMFGWLLASLGQQVGFPVPVGGAGRLTDALVARLEAAGGTVVTGCSVAHVMVEHGRASGVQLRDGTVVAARRAVVGACDAEVLYRRLVGIDRLPARFVRRLDRFQRADGTVKVDWALRGTIPWRDAHVGRAGTVHLADSLDELTLTAAQLATGTVPERPFVILGQMTTTDPSRSPAGTESAWGYIHVPQQVRGDAGGRITGRWDDDDRAAVVERIEARIEAHAPGFRDLIEARHVMTPNGLEASNPSLVGGDISGGTQQLQQQLIFRPVTGLSRPETPIAGLFLGSASAHPGGGVHGACGANAAQAALLHDRWRRRRGRISGSRS
jgi:phytoene dehydrogenase-like protein